MIPRLTLVAPTNCAAKLVLVRQNNIYTSRGRERTEDIYPVLDEGTT